jgi:hypothetical protein
MSFDELASKRKAVQLFCDRHAQSIEAFRSGESYKLTDEEPDLPSGLHHLTSTATCIESLLDCPPKSLPPGCKPAEFSTAFAAAAADRKPNQWRSEGSAAIYCRCRGLPLTIRFVDASRRSVVEERINTIFAQLRVAPDRFAIGEAAPGDHDSWYPPNAFHTYWTLELVDSFATRFKGEFGPLAKKISWNRNKPGMLLWARRTLGHQISLHAAQSSVLDSDQLAWSLVILLRFEDHFPADLGDQDLLREALKQLFGTQLPVGTWRHYRSLFHYLKAGNAYCYTYETFAALLKSAVQNTHGRRFVRDILSEHSDALFKLWTYADSTKVNLSEAPSDSSAVGWCSGHRLNQTRPESWATASVFAFAQAYRRLLGFWTRESAAKDLNVLKPRLEKKPEDVLKERGDTWRVPEAEQRSVTEQLFTMFINPVRRKSPSSTLEPDAEVLDKDQARSAILFGPPGASKTTLARAVAQCIDWQYIEIHANHFVADGMPQVHRRADEIFRRLMQLDHAVVFFDEIDELVRERDGGHEAFGRFLTTSMLPKLAELWDQRRVIYFVATNYIKFFDRAITRSGRFDALIMVSPPSYSAKVAEINRLSARPIAFSTDIEGLIWKSVERAGTEGDVDAAKTAEQPLPEEDLLAKFFLLRWDQMNELVFCLNSPQSASGDVTPKDLADALKQIHDRNLAVRRPYIEFMSDVKYPRRDYDKYQVWSVEPYEPDSAIAPFESIDGRVWLKLKREQEPPSEVPELPGYVLTTAGPGTVRCMRKVG